MHDCHRRATLLVTAVDELFGTHTPQHLRQPPDQAAKIARSVQSRRGLGLVLGSMATS